MPKAIALTLALLALFATSGQTQQARPIPMLVDAEWVAERLAEPDLVIIQVDQRRDGYDAGHVPGARYLAYERIAREVNGLAVELPPADELREAFEAVGVGDGVRVVLYGAPLSAARAWMTLDYLGISDRAAMLDGGIGAWRGAGLPITIEVPGVQRRALTVRPEPHRVVPADWVVARLEDAGTVVVDARPLAEYTGDDEGQNGRYLAGHIPGARHLHWEELIHSTADPRLRSLEELRSRFEMAGAVDGRSVLVYCTIGMRASMAYFVARMLGYETYLYDGSWADWSARKLPAVRGTAG